MRYSVFMPILIVFIMSFVMIPQVLAIEHPSQELDQLSKQVYDLTKTKQYEKAKEKMDELAKVFTSQVSDKNPDIESLDIMTRTIVQGKRAFASVELDEDRLNWHALQIRLMTDALTHQHQPLWKNYYKTYMEQVNQMISSVSRREGDGFREALERNYQLYATLRPAIAVSQSVNTVEMMDSLYQFLHNKKKDPHSSWEELNGGLTQLKQSAEQLFLTNSRDAYSPVSGSSPLGIIIAVAAMVLSTLTYVGWKKYKGERKVNLPRSIDRHK